MESENSKPQKDLIDDCFYVEQKRWGTWQSYYENGEGIMTSLSKENCIAATRFYIKGKQEGFDSSRTYDGTVGGKL